MQPVFLTLDLQRPDVRPAPVAARDEQPGKPSFEREMDEAASRQSERPTRAEAKDARERRDAPVRRDDPAGKTNDDVVPSGTAAQGAMTPEADAGDPSTEGEDASAGVAVTGEIPTEPQLTNPDLMPGMVALSITGTEGDAMIAAPMADAATPEMAVELAVDDGSAPLGVTASPLTPVPGGKELPPLTPPLTDKVIETNRHASASPVLQPLADALAPAAAGDDAPADARQAMQLTPRPTPAPTTVPPAATAVTEGSGLAVAELAPPEMGRAPESPSALGGTAAAPSAVQALAARGIAVGNAQPPFAGAYATTVETQVDAPGWGDEVGGKVVWLVKQKLQVAHIHLDPPELGPVEVKVHVHNDQANVTFNVQNSQVRDLLEQHVHRLREMLQQQGVNAGQVDVSAQGRDPGQQQAENGRGEGAGARGAPGHPLEGDEPAVVTPVAMPAGLVDAYA